MDYMIGARAHDYGRGEPDEILGRIAADGWQGVQIAFPKLFNGVTNWGEVTDESVQKAKVALDETKLQLWVLGVYVEPSMVVEADRKKSVDIFKSQLANAKLLGANCVGTETTNMEKQPAGTTREEAMLCLERSLAEILPEAERLGVTVAVEPVFYHAMGTPELTRRVLNNLKSPNLKVIFDPGNLYSPAEVGNQQQMWERAFDCFGDDIVAMHFKGVHVIDGVRMSCSLEDSQVDTRAVYRLLKQASVVPPILREEAVPARAKSDQALIKAVLADC